MLETGTVLQDRYEIIKPVGQGGMGAVYMARDQRLGNTVALKETFFSDAVLLAAFEREARILAGLRHAALPKVIDHFPDADGHFLVMEYIAGDDLQALLEKSGPPTVDEVLGWADQLLDALDYLHSQQPPIIHRDIKPQNLKLTSRNQIVLLDFGLAKGTSPDRTHTGSSPNSNSSIFGYTPGYAPLEQSQGTGTCPQSDIYSLAGTLYHLLTGRRPVDAVSRVTCVMNGEPDPLASAREINPGISIELNEIIMRGMALKKSERPSSAAEMRGMLRGLGRAVGERAADAQTELARTRVSEGGGPTAPPASSTQVLASAQTSPQAQPGSAASSSPRVSATSSGRATPARVPEKRVNPPWPAPAAYKRPATVEMASGGVGSSRLVIAGVAVVVAIAAIIFAFKSGSKDESANATPVIIQKIEQAAGSENPNASAKPAVESPGAQYSRTEPAAPSERPAAEGRTGDRDDDNGDARDTRVKEEARQEESAQESERAATEPAEPPPTQPPPRPEETVRDEQMRQPPPPPPHHTHRPPPPHPHPPPRGMPPPPGRRRP